MLHSDIQGAELDILQGFRKAIAQQKVGYALISTHGSNHESVLKFFRDAGYLIIAAHTVEESCSGDGLVVARSPEYGNIEHVEISLNQFSGSVIGRLRLLIGGLFVPRLRLLLKLAGKVGTE